MSVESRFSRRDFIGALGAFLLVGCESAEAKEKDFRQGDVIRAQGIGYRILDDGTYQIPDLPKFLYNIKADEYGVKVKDFPSIAPVLKKFPLRQTPSDQTISDEYSREPKRLKPLGGEFIRLASGILTSDEILSNPNAQIKPSDGFGTFRRELKSRNNFDDQDILINSYGKTSPEIFSWQDTLGDPDKTIADSKNRFKNTLLNSPFGQFNDIAHSFGGILELEIAMEYPWAFNNLFFLSSPLKGLQESFLFLIQFLKGYISSSYPFLKSILDNEKVVKYLIERGKDQKLHKKIDDFGESFTKSGKGIWVIRAENDPIVTKESAEIKGAKIITLPKASNAPFDLLAHGRTLIDPIAVNAVVQRIGQNRAAV